VGRLSPLRSGRRQQRLPHSCQTVPISRRPLEKQISTDTRLRPKTSLTSDVRSGGCVLYFMSQILKVFAAEEAVVCDAECLFRFPSFECPLYLRHGCGVASQTCFVSTPATRIDGTLELKLWRPTISLSSIIRLCSKNPRLSQSEWLSTCTNMVKSGQVFRGRQDRKLVCLREAAKIQN
jgi:hypothetical protein